MKKADAKYILEAIEWMNKNTTVASVDMETYGNLFMNSQNLLMDEVNDAEKSDEPALNLPVVNGCALLNEVLDHQQEVISSPIRFNGVHIDTIKQLFGKYGLTYKDMF